MRTCVVFVSLCVAAACAPPPEPPRTSGATTAHTKAAEDAAPRPPPQYVLKVPFRTSAGTRFDLAEDKIGVLQKGARWIVDGRGVPLAMKDDGLNITRVQAIDAGAGGGFLFVTGSGLFSSPTFDGELRQLAVGNVSTASAGPGFVLARMADGRTRGYELEGGKPFGRFPLGSVVVRTAKDGTAALITHGGRAFVSRDRAATWTDITADVGVPVGLEVAEGQLFVMDQTGEATRVDQSSVARATVPPKPQPRFDPDWTRPETPIEYVVKQGVFIGEDRALAIDSGAIVEVSLTSGKVVQRERGVLPPQGQCIATGTSQRVLFLCFQSDSSSVFSRPKRGGTTRLEKTFETRATFYRGAGDALLYAGPCKDSKVKPGVACLRTRDGEWTELDRSAELSDAPPKEPLKVVAWVPREGGAYVVVGGKNGGIWDAKSGSKSKLDDDQMKKIESLFSVSTSTRLFDRFAVADSGEIVGYAKDNGGFRVSDGGKKIEHSPFRFSSVVNVGASALAADSTSKTTWQSTDWGWTYTEVEGPSSATVGAHEPPRTCTDVGCIFTQWIRIGWEPRPPAAKPPPRPQAPVLDSTAKAPVPQLKCISQGATTQKLAKVVDQRFGFGAEASKPDGMYMAFYPRAVVSALSSNVEASNLRAAISAKEQAFEAPTDKALAQTRRVRWIEPFDPKATIRDSTIKLGELYDASRAFGLPPPDVGSTEERGQSITTLGDSMGALLSINRGAMTWVHGKEKPLALPYVDDGAFLIAGVQTGPEELTVLSQMGDGGLTVRTLGRRRANERFSIPAVPDFYAGMAHHDTLALGPDGKLAVVRTTTEAPPTKEDPALLLRPGEAPIALAPWSALEVDGTAACEGMKGHRMVLATRFPWLTAGVAAQNWGRELPLFLLVRWSATQLCLEAAEVPHEVRETPWGGSTDAYIVARFGKGAAAGEVAVGEGVEARDVRACELVR